MGMCTCPCMVHAHCFAESGLGLVLHVGRDKNVRIGASSLCISIAGEPLVILSSGHRCRTDADDEDSEAQSDNFAIENGDITDPKKGKSGALALAKSGRLPRQLGSILQPMPLVPLYCSVPLADSACALDVLVPNGPCQNDVAIPSQHRHWLCADFCKAKQM